MSVIYLSQYPILPGQCVQCSRLTDCEQSSEKRTCQNGNSLGVLDRRDCMSSLPRLRGSWALNWAPGLVSGNACVMCRLPSWNGVRCSKNRGTEVLAGCMLVVTYPPLPQLIAGPFHQPPAFESRVFSSLAVVPSVSCTEMSALTFLSACQDGPASGLGWGR